jgi:hypothetical protein
MAKRPLVSVLGLALSLSILGGCETKPEPIATVPQPTEKAAVPKGPASAADPKNVKPANAP